MLLKQNLNRQKNVIVRALARMFYTFNRWKSLTSRTFKNRPDRFHDFSPNFQFHFLVGSLSHVDLFQTKSLDKLFGICIGRQYCW